MLQYIREYLGDEYYELLLEMLQQVVLIPKALTA